jgi:hypothetical protein
MQPGQHVRVHSPGPVKMATCLDLTRWQDGKVVGSCTLQTKFESDSCLQVPACLSNPLLTSHQPGKRAHMATPLLPHPPNAYKQVVTLRGLKSPAAICFSRPGSCCLAYSKIWHAYLQHHAHNLQIYRSYKERMQCACQTPPTASTSALFQKFNLWATACIPLQPPPTTTHACTLTTPPHKSGVYKCRTPI